MTDRLTELLTDTPEEAAYDEAGRQAIIWSNLLKAAVRPEVQALRGLNPWTSTRSARGTFGWR